MKDIGLVAFVIAAGLIVVAMAVFAGDDTSVLTAPPDAMAESFVREIGMGRYELAVHYLSDGLQRGVSASTLRATFEPLRAEIGRPDQVQTETPTVEGDQARVLTRYEGRRGTATMHIHLVRERGLWRIATWPLDVVQRS